MTDFFKDLDKESKEVLVMVDEKLELVEKRKGNIIEILSIV